MGRPSADSPTKRKRKPKDANRPKRSTSSYFFFLAHCRAEAKVTGKNISKIAEFTKEASAQWRSMTPADKKEFDERAAKDKARYDAEMAVFKGKVIDPTKPKRPQTAYFLFLGDYRKKMKNTDIGHKDVIRQAGAEWRQLTDRDKKPYEEQSQVLQKKYDEELKKWREGGATGGASVAKARPPPVPANNGMDDDDEDDDEEDDDDEEEDDDEDDDE
ncbi:high mobility group protein B2-like [Mizuhopecten yessoensis]|uniref:High mobility group protein B3 n=1 Tax=Mizuhopecten yessoensis TaxID=6573 RepID=A0A210PF49_MIZYE|nr:high mobility group protein B2-like [Mizuhopecten yessoensis]OWF35109.1 High mobility group protein B3 [Mizuhopecten yessoensis]